MPGLATVDWGQVRSTVAAVAPRVTALLRSVRDPSAPALGEWSVAELAAHLTQVWEVLPRLVMGMDMASPLAEMGELAEFTTSMVRDEPERDPRALADRIEVVAAEFLAASATVSNDELRPWLVQGSQVSRSTLGCHLLNESLVHGYDIAQAERSPWAIERSHACLVLMGFIFPVLDTLDGRTFVDQERAAGLRACYDLRLRRGGRVFLVFADGELTVEGPSSRRVDCHLSADPAAFLLVVWGRQSQWGALRKGQLAAWGRRPWLGLKLRDLIATP